VFLHQRIERRSVSFARTTEELTVLSGHEEVILRDEWVYVEVSPESR
jgi:hypothetical protein